MAPKRLVEVEARLSLRMARTQIYPAVMSALNQLACSLRDQESLGLSTDRSMAEQMAALNQQLLQHCQALEAAIANPPHGVEQHLRYCAETLLPLMGQIRAAADGLEALVDDSLWPLPTYQEMLFLR